MTKIDHSITEGHIRIAKKLLAINSNSGSPEYAGLFVVTGLVHITHIDGHVENATLAATLTLCYLDIFPTAGSAVELTKSTAAPAISGFEVGSYVIKDREAAQILTVARANVAIFIEEDSAMRESRKPFDVGKKDGAVTTIRFVYTAGADYTSENGRIHWDVGWTPISDDGNVVAA